MCAAWLRGEGGCGGGGGGVMRIRCAKKEHAFFSCLYLALHTHFFSFTPPADAPT